MQRLNAIQAERRISKMVLLIAGVVNKGDRRVACLVRLSFTVTWMRDEGQRENAVRGLGPIHVQHAPMLVELIFRCMHSLSLSESRRSLSVQTYDLLRRGDEEITSAGAFVRRRFRRLPSHCRR